jgi:flavin reductase (DIM6/NTAB) family NADH-FMN oxidoreductase RutF
MFSANQTHFNTRKDTVVNAEETGKFVWNLATWDLREAVNISAEFLDADVDEFERTGLEKAWSQIVDGVPMVAASPVKFECEYHSTLRLPGNPPMGTADVIIGKVVGVHIADSALTDGKLDVRKTQPIARCGYYEYAVVRETFEMVIPGQNEALLAGLEGSATKSKKAVNEAEGKLEVS